MYKQNQLIVRTLFSLLLILPIVAEAKQYKAGDTSSIPPEARSKAVRDYYRELSEQEQNDISYIVDTLGHKPLAKLVFYRGSLEQAGIRLDNVHPLSFFSYIFTNDQLISAIRNMRRRGQIWKSYASGMSESFKEAYERNNISDDMIHDFAAKVGVDVNILKPALVKQQWEEFMNLLIKHVKRSGNSGRYDM
ncbi:MAG: hypothetical protein H7A37_10080 [Chlamydiales bacterium]|nr:hypothetical protein [Chlamydiales bacterium]